VSLAGFYENGDWQNESDWRGYEFTPEELLREQVQATRKERGHTIEEVARQTGLNPSSLGSFLYRPNKKTGFSKSNRVMRELLVAYIGRGGTCETRESARDGDASR